MRKIILLGFILINSLCLSQNQSENISDSLPAGNVTSITSNQKVIEIFKINSSKTFWLMEGGKVWVYCKHRKGKTKLKRCQITNIDADTLTFKPYDKDFAEIRYSGSEITFIAFTSAGRIIIASITNVVIFAAVVVVLVFAVLVTALTGGSSIGDPDLNWLPWVPFRKNISFGEYRKGQKKWGLRTADIP